MLISYLNSVPPLPDYLIESHNEIQHKLTKHFYINDQGHYALDQSSKKLEFCFSEISSQIVSWAEENMPFKISPIDSVYFVMYKDIEPHRDRPNIQTVNGITKRSDIGINYILNTGGTNVLTNLYDDQKNLIQQVCLEENRWLKIPIGTLHSVQNITEPPRIVIRITPTIDNLWEDLV